jgi:hypothetical protein
MRYSAAALIASVFLFLYASAQDVPRLPEKIADVVNIPVLKQQPTKIIDPVYPQIARQGWIQGKIVLDVFAGAEI